MARMSGGQSYDFYLITTGLPIDPTQGSLAKYYYSILVGAIGLQADILFENVIRIVPNIDVTPFLPGYATNQRNAFQFLVGVSAYSDPFTRQTLIQAVQSYALTQASVTIPNKNDYSFDPISTLDPQSGFNVYRGIGGAWTIQTFNVFYSDTAPVETDGEAGSIWIVNAANNYTYPEQTDGRLQFYYNDPNNGWGPISDSDNVTFSESMPAEVDGDWWINPTGFSFRQFSGNTWGSILPITFSATPPLSGTYWLQAINSYTLQVNELINTSWDLVKLSPTTVLLQSNNSNFLNQYSAPSAYNYTIDVEPLSLYGGPIGSGSATVTITTYDQETATGGANELFTNFFTNLPIANTIEVFVNGELQSPNGVTISGQNLQFIDSVNGFTLNAGDIVVAFYEFST